MGQGRVEWVPIIYILPLSIIRNQALLYVYMCSYINYLQLDHGYFVKDCCQQTVMNTPTLVSGLRIRLASLAHKFSANHLISKLNNVPRIELLFG